jgi:hypothetical protein
MAVYTVHGPASYYGSDVRTAPDQLVFVRDGFYFWAFLSEHSSGCCGTGCGWRSDRLYGADHVAEIAMSAAGPDPAVAFW